MEYRSRTRDEHLSNDRQKTIELHAGSLQARA